MNVDIVTLGVFIDIAVIVALVIWTDYRRDQEKRQRLERAGTAGTAGGRRSP